MLRRACVCANAISVESQTYLNQFVDDIWNNWRSGAHTQLAKRTQPNWNIIFILVDEFNEQIVSYLELIFILFEFIILECKYVGALFSWNGSEIGMGDGKIVVAPMALFSR